MSMFNRRLEVLKRRRDYLEQRIGGYSGRDNSRDIAEWSALKWAIELIESHPELEQEQPKTGGKVSDE